MSKRKFLVVTINHADNTSEELEFDFNDIITNFTNSELCDTEFHYTLMEEIDTILDLKTHQTIHFFEDRAKEFPCILKRIS